MSRVVAFHGWKYFEQTDFTGGENQNAVPELAGQNEFLLGYNCIKTDDGYLQTRLGKSVPVVTASLGASPVIGVWRWSKSNGDKFLLVQHGTTLYTKAWNGTAVLADWTGSVNKTGLTAGVRLRARAWKDNLIFVDPGNVANPFRFDGTAYTDLAGTPPKAKFIAVYGSRLWLVPIANPNAVQWSGLETYDTWDALDIQRIRDNDGDEITGLAPQTGGMVVTKNRSVHRILGTYKDDLQIQLVTDTVGCIAPDSLVDYGLFMGPDNLYTFTLAGVQPIGITHRVAFGAMTLADKQAAFAQVVQNEGRVVMSFGNGTVLNIEAQRGGILSWDSLGANCFSACQAKDDDGSLLIGDDTNGYVYKLNNTVDDNGSPIVTEFKSSYNDMGSMWEKVFRMFKPKLLPINNVSSLVYLSYDVDDGQQSERFGVDKPVDNIATFGLSDFGGADFGVNTVIYESFDFEGRGHKISFGVKIANRVKLLGYVTQYQEIEGSL